MMDSVKIAWRNLASHATVAHNSMCVMIAQSATILEILLLVSSNNEDVYLAKYHTIKPVKTAQEMNASSAGLAGLSLMEHAMTAQESQTVLHVISKKQSHVGKDTSSPRTLLAWTSVRHAHSWTIVSNAQTVTPAPNAVKTSSASRMESVIAHLEETLSSRKTEVQPTTDVSARKAITWRQKVAEHVRKQFQTVDSAKLARRHLMLR